MPEAIIVRPATAADHAQADRLFDELDALHRTHVPWMFCEPETPARTVTDFEQLCTSGQSSVWVAVAGAAPSTLLGVATALLRHTPNLSIFVPQPFVVLDNLVVATSLRRQGIGTLLVTAVEAWAASVGAAWVQLEMHAFNAQAESFYVAHGYLPLTRKLHKPLPRPR